MQGFLLWESFACRIPADLSDLTLYFFFFFFFFVVVVACLFNFMFLSVQIILCLVQINKNLGEIDFAMRMKKLPLLKLKVEEICWRNRTLNSKRHHWVISLPHFHFISLFSDSIHTGCEYIWYFLIIKILVLFFVAEVGNIVVNFR